MKNAHKQRSERKGKDTAAGGGTRKQQGEQQQSEQQDGGQQSGWNDNPEVPGRKPPMDRDRDYDPDGDRVGPDPGTAAP